MKEIEFAKRWRRQKSETVVERYDAGTKATVSNEVAAEAAKAGVLKGDPVDAAPAPSGENEADKAPPSTDKKKS